MDDGGRPPLYDDPLVMEAKIDQYFDRMESEDSVPTMAELAFELGFSARNALSKYEKKEEFGDTVKRARLRIEISRSKMLLNKDYPTAGLIFDLTNNHGWKNPQHLKHSGDDDPDAKPVTTVNRIELVAPQEHDNTPD